VQVRLELELDRTHGHAHRGLVGVVVEFANVFAAGDTLPDLLDLHEVVPKLLAGSGNQLAVLDLHNPLPDHVEPAKASERARRTNTSDISRLYSADPRTSGIGSTSSRTCAAASRITSSVAAWPARARSTARARTGTPATEPSATRASMQH